MAGGNTMIYKSGSGAINADRIKQLMRKLKKENDITTEEADEIYFSKQEIKSSSAKLINAAKDWYEVVAEKIEDGQRGNFVFTIDLSTSFEFMYPAQRAIKKHGDFQDLCDTIMINEKLYSLVPFKNLFTKVEMNPRLQGAYFEMENTRAGMYYYPIKTETGTYTISQFLKDFCSLPTFSGMHVGSSSLMFFEITAGGRDVLITSILRNVREIKYYVLAEFMRLKDVPCIVASAFYDRSSFLFVEKEDSFVVKKILETPLERLVDNALDKRIIDKQTAKALLAGDPVLRFSLDKFIKTSVEYLDETSETKIRIAQDMAEEFELPEEIR